jgi:hypothetical protein
MKKDDIINALSVMRTVMLKENLVHEPADIMIKELRDNSIYFESDLEKAFIAGWLCNYKTIADMKGFDFQKALENFKATYLT